MRNPARGTWRAPAGATGWAFTPVRLKSGDFFFSTFYILAPTLSSLALLRSTTTFLKSAAQAEAGGGRVHIPPPVAGMSPPCPIPTPWMLDVPPASRHGPWMDAHPGQWPEPAGIDPPTMLEHRLRSSHL